MEILSKDKYHEYEEFVLKHKNGSLMQSILWHGVKDTWGHDIVVARNNKGLIKAGISVLVKKVPGFNSAMLYAPRGPVCDYDDVENLKILQKGIDELAKKHNAYIFKVDPDILVENTNFIQIMQELGFERNYGPTGFETIQTRFNYRLYINERNADEILANMHHKTRYNIRLAERKGVEVKIAGKESLDEFMKIMEITGERDGFSIRPQNYFENMLDSLGEHIRLYMAYYEGNAISGAITSNYAGKTCYIYGASDNQFRNVMAPFLIQWNMILWALETNCIIYDFMGVSGNMDENDHLYGLYRFKNGFKGQVDELPGEFDKIYKPTTAKLVDMGIKVNDNLRNMKRKLKKSE